MALPKFCMFCGQRPISKNMEHPVPQWLMRLTGDPGRLHNVYPETERPLKSFRFPACEECNSQWGTLLEARADRVMRGLLADASLSTEDLLILMDWMDKVRIGLWLASLQLSNNRHGIQPKFHIASRVGHADRVLLLWKVKGDAPSLDWIGADTFEFHCMPSCFSLVVRPFVLLSASVEYLLAEGFGLPYPGTFYVDPKLDGYGVDLVAGKEKKLNQTFNFTVHEGATALLQSLYNPALHGEDSRYRHLFETPYVKQLLFAKGISRVLLSKGSTNKTYPLRKSASWKPPAVLDWAVHRDCFAQQTLGLQRWLIEFYDQRLVGARRTDASAGNPDARTGL
jgi:hypothetical protein